MLDIPLPIDGRSRAARSIKACMRDVSARYTGASFADRRHLATLMVAAEAARLRMIRGQVSLGNVVQLERALGEALKRMDKLYGHDVSPYRRQLIDWDALRRDSAKAG